MVSGLRKALGLMVGMITILLRQKLLCKIYKAFYALCGNCAGGNA